MDWELLTRCQDDARAGRYAQAMTGYLMWVAARYDDLIQSRPKRIQELRAQATASPDQHRRTPDIVADLAYGLEAFVNFAREIGALSAPEAEALWHRGWTALGQAAAAQAEHVGSAEPARRFLELLASALASGRAHVTADYGQEPANAATWGWRWRTLTGGDGLQEQHELPILALLARRPLEVAPQRAHVVATRQRLRLRDFGAALLEQVFELWCRHALSPLLPYAHDFGGA